MKNSPPSARAAENVRAALARRRIPVTALAAEFGRPYSWAQRRVSGQHPFSIDELDEVARFLGLSLSALIEQYDVAGVA